MAATVKDMKGNIVAEAPTVQAAVSAAILLVSGQTKETAADLEIFDGDTKAARIAKSGSLLIKQPWIGMLLK